MIGIATDFTAGTVLPVLADATPVCELPQHRGRPQAYAKPWRHHAAQPYADRINALARDRMESWPPRYSGAISAEWEFAKALQLLEEDPEIYHPTHRCSNSLIIIVRSCFGDRSLFGRRDGNDASLVVARRTGDLRGRPGEAGEAADRDTVRSPPGEP